MPGTTRPGARCPAGTCGWLARDAGTLGELPLTLSRRVYLHLFSGKLAAAASLAGELPAVTEHAGGDVPPYAALGLAAVRGQDDEARALTEAIGQTMGAEGFAERARRELMAAGQAVRKRTAETAGELTAQERQIAQRARGGRTNAEIGAELFLSPRTVEWHLSNIFAKLGITSRGQLWHALGGDAPMTVP